MARLSLIRHSPVDLPEGICYGRSDVDIQLDAEGLATLGRELRAKLPAEFLLFSSPLQRCRKLAEAIANGSEDATPPIAIDERFAEINFGDWELQRWDALPIDLLNDWAAAVLAFRAPNGEAVAEMGQRTVAAWQDAQSTADAAGLPLVIVSHGGPIRAILGHIAGEEAAVWIHRDTPHATPMSPPDSADFTAALRAPAKT